MATQTVSDFGRATGWVAAAALSSGLVVTSASSHQEITRARRIERGSDLFAFAAHDVVFDVVFAGSGSVFGASADAMLLGVSHPPMYSMMDEADDEPLFVEVAAPTIRVRGRVRSVTRSTAYEGTAFERGDDDDT
jgi:hypothetical protein